MTTIHIELRVEADRARTVQHHAVMRVLYGTGSQHDREFADQMVRARRIPCT